MTDRPCTDDDLRAAAALMHYALTTEPNPADADAVLSGHPAWANVEVGSGEEDDLRESVVELVSGAADVSEWAVNLGADGLKPDEHQLTWSAGQQPIVRVHFAFHDGMSAEARDYLVTAVGEAVGEEMRAAFSSPTESEAARPTT
ncbi:hypothetical protein [Streptomyces sp. C1-2]|uniref:hypothetical protein n=1 Tax=Streptomyces sp. C1-2 TaxID=2720022 RepID=UPI00143274D3|nr:hypothetical protein [Streptomyces sp. C1-2]NJP71919.1 hypothetical protein [Streptomyces sp. C1-2]